MTISTTTTEPIDLSGHWSENYAKNALKNGIMSLDKENKFNPDKYVTRSELITYIFKVQGYKESAYRNEFADVSANDSYAKMLQTMVDKGIISKDVNFRPNDNISRQELAKSTLHYIGSVQRSGYKRLSG